MLGMNHWPTPAMFLRLASTFELGFGLGWEYLYSLCKTCKSVPCMCFPNRENYIYIYIHTHDHTCNHGSDLSGINQAGDPDSAFHGLCTINHSRVEEVNSC